MNAPLLPRPVGRQREVLYLPAHGHTVVLGTAGSGKTTLAILRSLYLADQDTEHGGRTLLVTFNRCLVTYMRHLAGAIGGWVAAENYHRFARGYLSSRSRLAWGSISRPTDRSHFIRRALHEAQTAGERHAILQRPVEFFDEEFEWIQKHGIRDEREYADTERIGRVMARITRADRAAVFSLFSRYLEQRQRGGKSYDWSDLASAVLEELRADRQGRRYRHVVIDEGQDFSPEMLRSLAAAIPEGGSLTFFGDIAQQIYGHRMSWRSTGFAVRDVWLFRENYRNTRQISQLALALAAMPSFPDDPDLVEPTAPTAETRDRSPSLRSRWRPCRASRMTPTWWNRPRRPPTARFRPRALFERGRGTETHRRASARAGPDGDGGHSVQDTRAGGSPPAAATESGNATPS